MLRGSDKDNVLPIVAEGVINFRLLPGDTVDSAIAKVRRSIDDDRVEVSPLGLATDPSPASPVDTPAFEALARSVRAIHPDVAVAPYLVIGATDARHFVGVSDHVYRFLPFIASRADIAAMHGTDERIGVETYLDGIRFYRELIVNVTGTAVSVNETAVSVNETAVSVNQRAE
jgi:carboxypeptidase PM20D1